MRRWGGAGAWALVAWLGLVARDVGAAGARYTGAGSCAARSCHGSPGPVAGGGPRRDEYLVWSGERRLQASLGEDEHRRAYQGLLSEAGLGIARRLGMVDAAARADDWVERARDPGRCLACHAPDSPILRSDGVGCEACHGAAGGWRDDHFRRPYADALAAGLVDLRSPAIAGERCLGCHLGSPAQRVDHRTYAAGHPPLAFELDTFATFAPHWTRHEANAAWFGATPWLVGQVLTLRAAARLAAVQMRSGGWSDFAAYDCYACHHALAPAPRARPARGVVGLPPWEPARYAVLSRVVRALGLADAATLDAAVDRLAALVPHGAGGPETARACDRVVEVAGRVLEEIRRTPLDERRLTTLVRALTRDGGALAALGFHTAQQLAWGLDALVTARLALGPDPQYERARPSVARLLDDLADPAAYDPDRFARDLGGGFWP